MRFQHEMRCVREFVVSVVSKDTTDTTDTTNSPAHLVSCQNLVIFD